ncbi:hypothetical protein [Microbulbifer thermotolerans]|uniref:Lipoprotein n=1 Tax=Microbulbifer thermotolerans TaxID=252514 RepID=A0A143HQE9_MICTH|nr:hypothetical protein [Microbulbifer thermotolerans]AMX03949.1 hypothetical protein A3224_16330 [Microbulbifer thermotolerans]MCX2778521.1 hypothetical protein [Microbulbifer thermotolerans]MCX2782925.1 hypothetical protein [Microbulbifer thermotolerans]MCX2794004.1 hypothetical protein [Microbulbifer thermotolerans]MCX2801709.1 hypothetical protein [Microbulbifer thermotolerans]
MTRKPQSTLTGLILLGLLSACGHAAPPEGKRPSGPPPEAFEACEGKAEGDQVTFPGREGEDLEATCQQEDGQLVAVPLDAPRR